MKTLKETILWVLQNYLDMNVMFYDNFNAAYWYEKFTTRFNYYEGKELNWIFAYLKKIEKENNK